MLQLEEALCTHRSLMTGYKNYILIIFNMFFFFYPLSLVDVCQIYTVHDDVDRDVSHASGPYKCDSQLDYRWYRFLVTNISAIRMPTSCPPKFRCGTGSPGWLNGDHPTVEEGVVTRTICFHGNDCCNPRRDDIEVKNYGSFYVYHLKHVPYCSQRYCYTSS